MASILVTGGAGFIGSHLVDALVTRGHVVYVLDKEAPSLKRRNALAEYRVGDIREDTWGAWMAEKKPEIVFHLAACIDDRATDAGMVYDHNVSGSLRVFEAAKRTGAKKIIFASSCAVYGAQEKFPITEKARTSPQTPYGLSKLLGEQALFFYQSEEREVIAFRFANVYGPGQDGSKESGAVAIFTQKMLKNEPYFLNGDGKTLRDYVCVEDVVEALILGMQRGVIGVINIGTGKEISTKDLAHIMQKETGGTSTQVARPEVRDAVIRMKLAIGKAKRELGWKPAISLKKGIAKTISWYKKSGYESP